MSESKLDALARRSFVKGEPQCNIKRMSDVQQSCTGPVMLNDRVVPIAPQGTFRYRLGLIECLADQHVSRQHGTVLAPNALVAEWDSDTCWLHVPVIAVLATKDADMPRWCRRQR